MTIARQKVRRADFCDEGILRALRLQALADAPEAFASTYERECARTSADWQRWIASGITLILEDNGMARGLVSGMHDRRDPGSVHLLALWVHPDLRGSGAVDALVEAHLAWARSENAQRVLVDVFSTNPRARRLYERHGFRLTGHEMVGGGGRRELRMALPLGATISPPRGPSENRG